MDSMRNYQFEVEYDGSAVECSADVAAFRRAKVAGIDSGHELHAHRLEPCVHMRRDGAAATGSIANQVDDPPRSLILSTRRTVRAVTSRLMRA